MKTSQRRHAALMASMAALGVAIAACSGPKDAPPVPQSSDPLVQQGYMIAKQQSCFGCHKVEGKGGTSGPPFDSVGSNVQLANGTSVPVDDVYLKRSITNPDADIVQGYNKGVMSSAVSGKHFSDDQLNALVAYLKSVRKN